MYEFKCGNDSKIKLKGISKSQSKHIKFQEYKKCLDSEAYRKECDKYIMRSINNELYLQLLQNRQYLSLMIKDVMKLLLKVNHGSNSIIPFTLKMLFFQFYVHVFYISERKGDNINERYERRLAVSR